uniref:hypothetical protein n=1 Tax=Parerythrobacter lutipelagi TaxID=1964208 RepID=UPI0010F918AD|nr:hypothetical protein [Parerythrobacter lutipelagi]
MPNIDTDCYFLTAFVPVRNEGMVEHRGIQCSPIDAVRSYLELMPTALQSPETEEIGLNSPFARNLRTHFARVVVLEQPYYNGRNPSNPVIDQIRNVDLLKPEPSGQLSCPYLMVFIDYDLLDPSGEGEPRRYLEELWDDMADELRSIFGYCYGFEDVIDGQSFATYLMRCQLDSNMSVHDYWWQPEKLPSLPFIPLLALPVLALLLPLAAALLGWIQWPWAIAGAVLLPLAAFFGVYRLILAVGPRPWPASPDASLRNVLKGLYLQQAFTEFAIEQQSRDPAERGAAFRTFLERNRPADLESPTQPAGVIRSDLKGGGA